MQSACEGWGGEQVGLWGSLFDFEVGLAGERMSGKEGKYKEERTRQD